MHFKRTSVLVNKRSTSKLSMDCKSSEVWNCLNIATAAWYSIVCTLIYFWLRYQNHQYQFKHIRRARSFTVFPTPASSTVRYDRRRFQNKISLVLSLKRLSQFGLLESWDWKRHLTKSFCSISEMCLNAPFCKWYVWLQPKWENNLRDGMTFLLWERRFLYSWYTDCTAFCSVEKYQRFLLLQRQKSLVELVLLER